MVLVVFYFMALVAMILLPVVLIAGVYLPICFSD